MKEPPLVTIYHFKESTLSVWIARYYKDLLQLTLYRLDPSTTQSGGAKATASEME